ncbi:hypothetical protein [Nitratifractor sp.]
MVTVSTTRELRHAIENADSETTILLEDGNYTDVHVVFPRGLHHVTIKAKGEHAVIYPRGRDDDSAFTLPNVARRGDQVHDINFVGFTVRGDPNGRKQFVKSVHGRWVDSGGDLHDYGEENPRYGPFNIYFYNLEVQDLFMGIYSGLQAHDWTVERCTVHHSLYSHFWYMMGWHLAVVDSTFEEATHDALAIRGYYPEGEVFTYIGKADSSECYGNVYTVDRGSRSVENGFLPPEDWTHIIRGNTFRHLTTLRDAWNVHVAVAYSIYGDDPPCGAERVYLPPQNIRIVGNLFDNTGEEDEAHSDAIAIDAYAGIENDSPASVNGITIRGNRFIRAKSDERFLTTDDPHTDLNDLDPERVRDNEIVDSF